MENIRILFYDAKPYDKASFAAANKAYNFEFKFLRSHLTEDTAIIAQGYDVICLFVNDQLTANIAQTLFGQKIRLVALRCAGF